MTWFRVDDKFASHPKVLRIPRDTRAAAIGTWTLCGTWSARYERDGFVPDYIVTELGGSLEAAQALVAVKLWRASRGGFRFLNWREFQPTRADNEIKREAERKRKAEYRAREAVTSAYVPTGQSLVPNTPSRPDPEDVKDLSDHPHVSSAKPNSDDLSTGLSPTVQSVLRAVERHCGRNVHPLVAHDITAWLDERRGPNPPPLKVPARYYGSAIARSSFEVQQFIDEKGLAS